LLMLKKKKVIEVVTHVTRLDIRTKFALNIKTSIQLALPENRSTSARSMLVISSEYHRRLNHAMIKNAMEDFPKVESRKMEVEGTPRQSKLTLYSLVAPWYANQQVSRAHNIILVDLTVLASNGEIDLILGIS